MAQRALVTGATAGIGREFARQLAARGHTVVLVARDTQRLQALADEIGGEVLTADLTDRADLDRVAEAVRGVDLLVNNAGASLNGWFGTTDISDEDRQLDLLVRAPMHLMDAALKAMAARGSGGIINVASVAAYLPRGSYSAHKAWLLNLTQWAHLRHGPQINVMALCPGFVRTEFHQRMGADMSGVPSWMWLTTQTVVSQAMRDFDRHKAVSIPSKRYKMLTAIARVSRAPWVYAIARKGR